MKVAVYGTLREGFGNHRLLAGSEFIGKTKTEPIFTMYGSAIPWIVAGGNTAITVEVYEVDEVTMRNLDRLEGYPYYYDRKEVSTEFGDAWIYFREEPGKDEIPSGDWAQKVLEKFEIPW